LEESDLALERDSNPCTTKEQIALGNIANGLAKNGDPAIKGWIKIINVAKFTKRISRIRINQNVSEIVVKREAEVTNISI